MGGGSPCRLIRSSADATGSTRAPVEQENGRGGGRRGIRCWVERVEIAGGGVLWRSELSLEVHRWIADHRVQDRAVVPATAYIELGLAAAFEIRGDEPVRFEDAAFSAPLFLADGVASSIQCSLSDTGRFQVHSRQDGGNHAWTLHFAADLRPALPPDGVEGPSEIAGREIRREEFYSQFAELGNTWGPAFQGVANARVSAAEGSSRTEVPPVLSADFAAYRFHPAVADACGHILPAIRAFAPGERRVPWWVTASRAWISTHCRKGAHSFARRDRAGRSCETRRRCHDLQ